MRIEAALFNLGVSVFDSVVDDEPQLLGELEAALHPDRVAERLRLAAGSTARPALCSDRAAELVVALFDRALHSAAARLEGDFTARLRLHRLLVAMYESELGLSSDRRAAKTLPVVFIGELAGARRNRIIEDLYAKLAAFLCLYDDWQDVDDDRRSHSFNTFSRAKPRGLFQAFQAALEAASACPDGVADRLALLCNCMFGSCPVPL